MHRFKLLIDRSFTSYLHRFPPQFILRVEWQRAHLVDVVQVVLFRSESGRIAFRLVCACVCEKWLELRI